MNETPPRQPSPRLATNLAAMEFVDAVNEDEYGPLSDPDLQFAYDESLHPRDEQGRWTVSGGGGESQGKVQWDQPRINGRPIPIRVATVEDAVPLVLAGKVVEVPTDAVAYTLIGRLADVVNEMRAKGEKAQDFDLCKVTVAHTNLFCADKLRSEQYPHGVPRLEMPQLNGHPVEGSLADQLPRNPWDPTEVDGGPAFMAHLTSLGVATTREEVYAANLRASQRELVGSKVAKMMNDRAFDPGKNPIFISKDNYVVDGHHRWAAVIGRDLEDAHLGDLKIHVIRVDAPITEVLHLANVWSKDFGIQQVAGVAKTTMAKLLAELAFAYEEAKHPRDPLGRWSETEGGDIIAFHGTSKGVAEKIRAEGITLGHRRSFPYGELYQDDRGRSVFVASTPEFAFKFAQLSEAANRVMYQLAVVELHVPKTAWAKFQEDTLGNSMAPDVAATGAAYTVGNIPKEWVVHADTYGTFPWKEKKALFAATVPAEDTQTVYLVVFTDPSASLFAYDESQHPRDQQGQWTDKQDPPWIRERDARLWTPQPGDAFSRFPLAPVMGVWPDMPEGEDRVKGDEWQNAGTPAERYDADPHTEYRGSVYANVWGSSHRESSNLAELSAWRMGLIDDPPHFDNGDPVYSKPVVNMVDKWLGEIADDKVGTNEVMYHSFANAGEGLRELQMGKEFSMPLTAMTGDKNSSFGIRLEAWEQDGEPTKLEFAKGTKMMGYQKWKKSDAKDFGYKWDEGITAGTFKVVGTYLTNAQGWTHTPVRVWQVKQVKGP